MNSLGLVSPDGASKHGLLGSICTCMSVRQRGLSPRRRSVQVGSTFDWNLEGHDQRGMICNGGRLSTESLFWDV